MADETKPSKPLMYPNISTHTRTLEQKRLMLWRAMVTRAGDERIAAALRETLLPVHLQRAAQRGVFISYHRADEVFALELDTELRTAQIKVWLDTIDVAEGSDWRSEVLLALRTCGVMLMVLSPQYVADPETTQEYQSFLEMGKIVIPVLHETCHLKDTQFLLPMVDFRVDMAAGVRQLLRTLRGEVQVV